MADLKNLETFRLFRQQMSEALEEGSSETNSAALISVFAQTLLENGETEQIELAEHEDFEGRNRCKFDGVCFNETLSRCDLIICLPVEETNMLVSMGEIENVVKKAGRVFRYAVNKDHDRFRGDAFAAVSRLSAERDRFSTGRVIVLTNGIVKNPDEIGDNTTIDDFPVSIRFFDLVRYSRLNQEKGSLADIQIKFSDYIGRNLPCVEEKYINKDYDTYLAIFSGDLIYQLFETYGPKLYEFNVRSFLQARSKVNRGLRDTLKGEPEKFLAYNNGLVATVENLEIETEHGVPFIKSVQGLQIVNGAQTTASIHRAKKIDGVDVSTVSVAAKITHVRSGTDQEFVSKISLYANSQNVIQLADLSANNEFHVEIERLSETTWCPGEQERWFYERARGSYQMAEFNAGTTKSAKSKFKAECPPAKKFQKTDIAKVMHAWRHRPHIVSQGAQKNFNVFMQEMQEFGATDWTPNSDYFKKLISYLIIYKTTEKIIRSLKYPAYRANIAAYTVAYMSLNAEANLDYQLIWSNQAISEQFEAAIRKLTDGIDKEIRRSGGSLNITEWAKKEACWQEVSQSNLQFDWQNVPEFGAEVEDVSDAELGEAELISWCRSLSADNLKALLIFGTVSDRLLDIEAQVISTMVRYASSGWTKPPSAKQSARVRNAFLACEKQGFSFE